MRAQKWIRPSALASTWRRVTCDSISAPPSPATTTGSSSPRPDSPSGSPLTPTAPQCQPRRDWRNGAGGTPNPRQASYGRDTQCRSSHPCSCCFATTNTKSAGSRGRKNGPCRCRSSARASDADTSVTYEALGVLGQPGRAGLQRLPPEPTRARRAIRRPSPRC